MLETPEADLEIGNDRVQVITSPNRFISLSELAKKAIRSSEGPISGQWVLGRIPTFPSYSVDVATVEVDMETGKVRVIDLVAGQDVGKAINPILVEGQIQGGMVQGMGLGMMEGYQHDAEGHVLNANLLDYPLPTITDVPKIQVVLFEEPCPNGPYGAKGVGEPPIIPGAAAIANAIHNAVGVRLTDLPMRPDRVLVALRTQGD
jgi:CO/xanthine dehydrogenase Mo-binding subunit